jgi:hypothetical protein
MHTSTAYITLAMMGNGKHDDTGQKGEVWIKSYAPSDFDNLHHQIYPIVEIIVQQPIYYENPFTLWNSYKSARNKYPMTRMMKWRHAKLAMNLDNLNQYKDFIMSCPTIARYLILKLNRCIVKNELEFGIIESNNTELENIHASNKIV